MATIESALEFQETAYEAVRQLRRAAYRLQDQHQDPQAAEMLAAADALADALPDAMSALIPHA
ncbi:MAG TPA: hypothetical protein DD420_32190 [Streptomyces sp.]|nr:hypothetical protein [Streptomyces sp.]